MPHFTHFSVAAREPCTLQLCAVPLQWHKMSRKCPDHPSRSFLTSAGDRIKFFTGCYFFACLVFSPHDMSVFVTDFTCRPCCQLTCRDFQVEFWWFFVRNCVKWEEIQIHMWLPYTVKHAAFQCKIYRFQVVLLEYVSIQSNFSNNVFQMKCHMSHTVLCSCTWIVHVTVYAVELQSHKTCTGNALTIPGTACSQQLLRKTRVYTVCYFFAIASSFQPMIWMYLWQISL